MSNDQEMPVYTTSQRLILPVNVPYYLSTCSTTCLCVILPVHMSYCLSVFNITCHTVILPVSQCVTMPLNVSYYISMCHTTCQCVILPVNVLLFLFKVQRFYIHLFQFLLIALAIYGPALSVSAGQLMYMCILW